MKKIFLTLIAAIVCMISVATAQTRMEWKTLGIEFTLAKGLVVQTNDAEAFVAASESEDFVVSLGPLDRAGVPDHMLGKIVGELAINKMGIDAESAEIDTFSFFGGHGSFIMGVDNDGQFCLMAIAVSAYDRKALVVAEYFTEEHIEEAVALLSSIQFKKLD